MGCYSMRCCKLPLVLLPLVLLLASCAGEPSAMSSIDPSLSADADQSNQLTITGLTLITKPDAEPILNATVVINDGKIVKVFQGEPSAIAGEHLAANGKVATAGLWNSHVHFTSPQLATEPQAVLNAMLLRYGFTQVVDTGSEPKETLGLRLKIGRGELAGPRIYMANGSFVGAGGSPAYLPGIALPEVTTTAQAAPMVEAVLGLGVDGIKIFSGSFLSPEKTIYLEPAVVEAIVAATHGAGSLVVAHPTTVLGLSNAVAAGVDVIAHTTAPEIEISPVTLAQMLRQGTALVPTLKLWRYEMDKFGLPATQADFMEQAAVAQLGLLHSAGVRILFGTDVGYMSDYDPQQEYKLMHSAGMSWRDILRAATTAPAQRFGIGDGTVATGRRADLVIYAKDPRKDVGNFTQVAYTIVDGKVLWSKDLAAALEGDS